MPGSPTELQTVWQNLAANVNALAQTAIELAGSANYPAIDTTTLVKNAAGRLVTVSITTAGSSNGTIYDSNSTSVTTRPIYTIPNTLGIVVVNIPVGYGIVIAPGTGQVLTVTYS